MEEFEVLIKQEQNDQEEQNVKRKTQISDLPEIKLELIKVEGSSTVYKVIFNPTNSEEHLDFLDETIIIEDDDENIRVNSLLNSSWGNKMSDSERDEVKIEVSEAPPSIPAIKVEPKDDCEDVVQSAFLLDSPWIKTENDKNIDEYKALSEDFNVDINKIKAEDSEGSKMWLNKPLIKSEENDDEIADQDDKGDDLIEDINLTSEEVYIKDDESISEPGLHETPEHRAARLAKDRERRIAREKNRVRLQERRKQESMKKEMRRYNNTLRVSIRRSRETPEQRIERRIKDALRSAERRRTESKKQRQKRLVRDRERIALRRLKILLTDKYPDHQTDRNI